MFKSVKRLGLSILLIIILPVIIIIFNELGSLNENEVLLRRIYSNQLETILFSVNQYSNDAVNAWVSSLSSYLKEYKSEDSLKKKINNIFAESDFIRGCFISENNRLQYFGNDSSKQIITVANLIKTHKITFNKLLEYSKAGYRKIESIEDSANLFMFFYLRDSENNPVLSGFYISPRDFINNVVANRINLITDDPDSLSSLRLAVFSKTDESIIFPANRQNIKTDKDLHKKLWLLPNYELGFYYTGKQLADIVKERAYTNLALILLLIITLVLGLWVIYRNMRKEIELAMLKADFVANVSHELRTPLALISMFAETLNMDRVKSEDKKKEYYSIISTETNRLSKIVNKILNFSKMEAGKRIYHLELNDVNEISEEIVKTYKYHLENKGFKVEFTPAEDLPLINGDKEAIGEAIINLIDNSVKYSEDVKEISIKTESDDEHVYIKIADKGIGISEENQKKIFDKFFRVESHLVQNTKGTGLGLAIIKHILDAHKGEIIVESTPWKGSTFTLKFPAASID